MRDDYTADPARCLTTVAFVPDEIGGELRRRIIEPLREVEPGHHYYAPASMHLTIKNVRSVHSPPLFTAAEIARVDELFAALVPRHRAFVFSLEEVVAFATSVVLIGYCDESLKSLVQALDAGLRRIGVPDDKRYVSEDIFFGNVTLCRFRRRPSTEFLQAVDRLAHAYRRELPIEVLHLITCNAVCGPESRRTLSAYRLKGPPRRASR